MTSMQKTGNQEGAKHFFIPLYTGGHNHVPGIVYRNICAEYDLEVQKSKWNMLPGVVENDQAKISVGLPDTHGQTGYR